MAEAAKALSPTKLPKVLHLVTQDGGLYLGVAGTRTELPSPNQYAGQAGALKDLEMELDRALGGVVLRWVDVKKGPRTMLVPLSHLRQVELAE